MEQFCKGLIYLQYANAYIQYNDQINKIFALGDGGFHFINFRKKSAIIEKLGICAYYFNLDKELTKTEKSLVIKKLFDLVEKWHPSERGRNLSVIEHILGSCERNNIKMSKEFAYNIIEKPDDADYKVSELIREKHLLTPVTDPTTNNTAKKEEKENKKSSQNRCCSIS